MMEWLTSCLLPREQATNVAKEKARIMLRDFFYSLTILWLSIVLSHQAFVLVLYKTVEVRYSIVASLSSPMKCKGLEQLFLSQEYGFRHHKIICLLL